MKLSIVSTLYHSAATLEEFYNRVVSSAESISDDVELVLVNDDSPDDSLEIALGLHRKDPRVRVADLSRNFGHHKAMMTGLRLARGDLIFLIDCDLEEQPELLPEFYAALGAHDVVYGVQQRRKGDWIERLSGRAFFCLFNLLSEHRLPTNLTTVRLMTRRYVDSLLAHQERETIIAGLWVLAGYEQLPIPIVKGSRGSSTYTLRRKLTGLVNAVTSFSDRPLILVFYLGCSIVLVSSLTGAWLILRKLLYGINTAGWASLAVSIWLLGGLTIFCLGVIGIYLSKVFIETKQRPYTIIRQLYEHSAQQQSMGPDA